MNYLAIKMFLFGWFFRWKTKQDTINKMKLRTKDEIIVKKKEFEQKYLLTDKQNNGAEKEKYKAYLDVLKWMLKET